VINEILKIKTGIYQTGGKAQVAEHLPYKHKILSSIPTNTHTHTHTHTHTLTHTAYISLKVLYQQLRKSK
jgi:hypothetical protein